METFINSAVCISHHPTFDPSFFFEGVPVFCSSPFLKVSAPDYKPYIPSSMNRRASHVLRMGIGAGMMALERAKMASPDAIVIGTGMGCFEDTDKFLRSLLDNDEQLLAPTSFIQSTHNSVAGQIALLTKCQGHNFTYVHQNNSFEWALLDALMLLQEKEARHVLVGGLDELNDPLQKLFQSAGHITSENDLATPIWESKSRGYCAGEGSAFFSVSGEKTLSSIGRIRGVKTIQKVNDAADLTKHLETFLAECDLKQSDLDLLLSGVCGDDQLDQKLKQFQEQLQIPTAYFKHLCGEYFTASAFALWFALGIIQKQQIPVCALPSGKAPVLLRNIAIVNHHSDQLYSLMIVSSC